MLQECAITPSSLAYRRVDSCNTARSQYDTEKAAGTSGIPPRKENLSLSLPESTRPSFLMKIQDRESIYVYDRRTARYPRKKFYDQSNERYASARRLVCPKVIESVDTS